MTYRFGGAYLLIVVLALVTRDLAAEVCNTAGRWQAKLYADNPQRLFANCSFDFAFSGSNLSVNGSCNFCDSSALNGSCTPSSVSGSDSVDLTGTASSACGVFVMDELAHGAVTPTCPSRFSISNFTTLDVVPSQHDGRL